MFEWLIAGRLPNGGIFNGTQNPDNFLFRIWMNPFFGVQIPTWTQRIKIVLGSHNTNTNFLEKNAAFKRSWRDIYNYENYTWDS